MATAALLAPAVAPAVAGAVDPSQALVSATIVSSTGSVSETPDTVDFQEIQGCPDYTGTVIHDNDPTLPGGTYPLPLNTPGVEGSWPLWSALDCLSVPITLNDIASVVVFNDSGVAEAPLMAPSDLAPMGPDDPSGPDFEYPGEVPVVSVGDVSDGDTYTRPARNPDDPAYEDQFQTHNGAPIDVYVYEGNSFPVTISTSPQTITSGTAISFSGTGAPAGDQLQYQWSFEDGTPQSSSAATPSVTFAEPGQYQVQVQVRDESTQTTGIGQTTITVNGPTTQTTTTPTPTNTGSSSGTGSAPTGPIQGTGTTPGGVITGPASGGPGATTTTPASSGGSGAAVSTHTTTSSTTTSASGPSGTTPVTGTTTRSGQTTTTTTSAAGASGGANGSSGSSSGHSAGSTPGAASRRPAPAGSAQPASSVHRRPPSSQAGPRGRRISGLLLSEVVPISVGAGQRPSPATASPAAAALDGGHSSLWAGLGGGAAAVLLLGLGVGREFRGRRRFRVSRIRTPTA